MAEYRCDYTPEQEVQLQTELHRRLQGYIDGGFTLHELRHWLTHRSWRVNPQNTQLWGLYAITRSRIMDFDDGDWTQDQLRASLAHHAPAGHCAPGILVILARPDRGESFAREQTGPLTAAASSLIFRKNQSGFLDVMSNDWEVGLVSMPRDFASSRSSESLMRGRAGEP